MNKIDKNKEIRNIEENVNGISDRDTLLAYVILIAYAITTAINDQFE